MKTIYIKAGDFITIDGKGFVAKESGVFSVPISATQTTSEGVLIDMCIKQ
jgi:hypothetical protein